MDAEFTAYLREFFGDAIIDKFQLKFQPQYLQLLGKWELLKKSFRSNEEAELELLLPPFLRKAMKRRPALAYNNDDDEEEFHGSREDEDSEWEPEVRLEIKHTHRGTVLHIGA